MLDSHSRLNRRQVQSRDPRDAVAALVDSHGGRIRSLALRMCGNAADADDVVQDVFLTAFRRWETFRGDADPGTWLFSIALRSCKRRMRQKGGVNRAVPAISQLLPFGENQITALAAKSDDPSAARSNAEAIATVQNAIAQLPEHFRAPLILKELLELSIDDVAATLDLKPDTVKTRLHRARLLLRKSLLKQSKRTDAPMPIYEKQVCLDLLKAKLAAMDGGRMGSFKVTQGEMCDRCRAVFTELDIVQNACAAMAQGSLPRAVANAIRSRISARDESEYQTAPRRRGRKPVRARTAR